MKDRLPNLLTFAIGVIVGGYLAAEAPEWLGRAAVITSGAIVVGALAFYGLALLLMLAMGERR